MLWHICYCCGIMVRCGYIKHFHMPRTVYDSRFGKNKHYQNAQTVKGFSHLLYHGLTTLFSLTTTSCDTILTLPNIRTLNCCRNVYARCLKGQTSVCSCILCQHMEPSVYPWSLFYSKNEHTSVPSRNPGCDKHIFSHTGF